MRLGSKDTLVPVSVIPSGSISLDYALGAGGFPRGRICEIFGPESSGKTTVALQVIAEAQKLGGMGVVPSTWNTPWIRFMRASWASMWITCLFPNRITRSTGARITGALINSGSIDVLVVDSVAALVPKAELDGEMGDSHMGVQARLMSQAMRKLTGNVSKSNTCLDLHQPDPRKDRGHRSAIRKLPPAAAPLKFYSSIRADIRRIAAIKDGDVLSPAAALK